MGAGLGAAQNLGGTTEGCRLGPTGRKREVTGRSPLQTRRLYLKPGSQGAACQDPPNSKEGEEGEDVAPTSGRKDSGLRVMLKYGMSSGDPFRRAKGESNEAKA